MSKRNTGISRLLAVLVLSLLAVLFFGFSSETQVRAADSDFSISNGNLYAYNGSDKIVTVPKGVEQILGSAFSYNTGIEEIILPEGIKVIGYSSFSNCSVKKINFPDSLVEISPHAFKGCSSLQKVSFGKNLKTIGKYAFDGCTSLSSVKFGSGLSSIEESAFSDCSSIESVKFPSSLKEIGYRAFYKCSGLKTVTIPKKNKLILVGSYAFYGTKWFDGLKYNKNGLLLHRGILFGAKQKDGILSIPSGTRIVAGGAFSANMFTEIEIPKTLVSICDSAFYSSYYLKKINIPVNVKYIYEKAFANSHSLDSVKLHEEFKLYDRGVIGTESVKADKITDNLCREIYSYLCEGKDVHLYLSGCDTNLSVEETDAYVQNIFDRIGTLEGMRCTVFAGSPVNTSSARVSNSEYPDGVIRYTVYAAPFLKLKKADSEIYKNVETVTIKDYSDAETGKLDAQYKKGKSFVIKFKASAKQAGEKSEKINKKLQKYNRAGVIPKSSGKDNIAVIDGIAFASIPYTKSGYTSIYISGENAKIYSYAVEFVNKLFSTAKGRALSDSKHGSSFSNAKSVLSKADSMCELSDAMKVYAIAVSRYFGAQSQSSAYMEYSMKNGYSYYGIENDSARMKNLLDGKASGVCEDFARYEILLFSQLGIESWYNESMELNHAWSVAKVTNSEGKVMYVPFDYDIGPHPLLSGAHYDANDAKQVAERYKIYLNGIPGTAAKKNFSDSDFK